MNICIVNGYNSLNQNQRLFNKFEGELGSNVFDGCRALYKYGRDYGCNIYTPENLYAIVSADVIIFLDWITSESIKYYYDFVMESSLDKVYLIRSEHPFFLSVMPDYSCFEKVFTYEVVVPDGIKRQFNYSINTEALIYDKILSSDRPIFCSMFGTNRLLDVPNNLYGYRANIAKAMSNYYGDKFHLYGRNWNLSKIPSLGFANNKFEILSKSVFSICTENFDGEFGYVTEKLLEVVSSGAIPIYYNKGHASHKLPDEIYVNCADLSPDLLPQYLSSLTAKDIKRYKDNALDWIRSERFAKFFDAKTNALNLLSEVKG